MRGLAVLAALAFVSGCVQPAPENPGEDLFAAGVVVAEKRWNGVLLEPGSPAALPFLSEDGWSHGETAPDGNTFRWAVGETASFRLRVDENSKRIVWIECEPFRYEGSPTQWIALQVNGEPATEIELRPARERYPVEVPLVAGDNVFDLRFRYAGDPNQASADRRRLAVAFYRIDVLPPGEHPVAGQPAPFSWDDGRLFVPEGGAVTVLRELSGEARLAVAPEAARLDARLVVNARTEEGRLFEQMLASGEDWERTLRHSGPVALDLRAEGGPFHADVSLVAPSSAMPVPEVQRTLHDNVVLVVLDGANALRMGLYGYERDTTPFIDELGERSLVYDVALSQAVYTIASIGSLLTGQYPERHQSVSFADKLHDDVVTLPELLAAQGYRTAAFSGNAVASATFGLDQGYDEFIPVWERDGYTGHGDSVLGAFREWMERRPEGPFFAYVHFREPHFPYNPPPPFDARFGASALFPDGLSDKTVLDAINDAASLGKPPGAETLARIRDLYDGNLAYVDDLVGKLLACLEEHGVYEDSVVIVTADHGEALFEHGFIGHNTQLYEESIRVPLLIRLPDGRSERVPGIVELIDLAPTILDVAGVTVPEAMQGTSLLRNPANRGPAFSRSVWKRARYSIRNERYKLIWDSRTGGTELYDLENDPEETRDLYGSDGKELTAGLLKQSLLRWLREQEHLRATSMPPEAASMSEQERRRFESLGYTDFLPPKR